MAQNEEMVRKMAQAGFRTIFLGIESSSRQNLEATRTGNIVEASKQAVANCHKYDMMVIGGLIFGFPEDDETAIINNYRFFLENKIDAAYCQILTPYPKTRLREELIELGLVTNKDNYRWYDGVRANIKTKHLDSEKLQYLVWYHRQKILGWWDPAPYARKKIRLWTAIWIYALKPVLKLITNRRLKKYGWKNRYLREMARLSKMNIYPDLETFK